MLSAGLGCVLLALVCLVQAQCPCSNPEWCSPLKIGPRKELYVFGSSGASPPNYHCELVEFKAQNSTKLQWRAICKKLWVKVNWYRSMRFGKHNQNLQRYFFRLFDANKSSCFSQSLSLVTVYASSDDFSDNYTQFDYTHLTTLVWWTGDYDAQMVCHAHSKGVRVIKPVFFSANDLGNVTARAAWLRGIAQEVKEKMLDGVNFDFEDAIVKGSPNSALLTSLTKELAALIRKEVPGGQVTFDVGWSPECIDVRCYDYKALADATDFLVVMDYDEQSQIFGPCKAGANSPLPYLVKALNIPSDKLVMALPWYGHDFPCINQVNQTVCPLKFAPWRGAQCTDLHCPEIGYEIILRDYIPISTTGVKWDDEAASPWLNFIDKKDGSHHQLWFDNPESLKRKVSWAKFSGKLRGVGVFTVDYVDYNNKDQAKQMWDAMNYFF